LLCQLGVTGAQHDRVVGTIISAAIRVHDSLGPGLLESAYQACLSFEMTSAGLQVETQVPLPLKYGSVELECGYRLDFVVDRDIIIEVKSVETVLPIHKAQVMTYVRLTGARRGLLFNFNESSLKAGLHSFLGPGNKVPEDKRKP